MSAGSKVIGRLKNKSKERWVREWKLVHALVEASSKIEMSEGRWKGFYWDIEFNASFQRKILEADWNWFQERWVREGGKEHWLVKVISKRKMDEGRREQIHRVIKVHTKFEVGERGWEEGNWIHKRERKF